MSVVTTSRTAGGAASAPVRRRRPFPVRRALTILAYLLPALIPVAVFTYYPVLIGAQMAFRRWVIYDIANAPWVGLDNFKDLFVDADFQQIALNTVVWVVGSLVPQLLIGFGLALLMRRRFRGRGLYQALVFYPWAVSGFLIGILFRWMFNAEFGVINDLLRKAGLITTPIPWLAQPDTAMVAVIVANVWYGVTFFAIMILAALQSIPDEMLEAAALDGAGKVATLFLVVIPSIRNTLLLTVLLRVIWIFNFPDLIFGMTRGGPANQTHIITSWMIVVTQKGDYGVASAMGLLVVGFLTIFTLFYLTLLRRSQP